MARQLVIPGAPFGDAATIDGTKGRFALAWLAFEENHGTEKLAETYAEMNWPDRAGRR